MNTSVQLSLVPSSFFSLCSFYLVSISFNLGIDISKNNVFNWSSMDSSPSFSPLVVGFDFFTEGEKPTPSASSPKVRSLHLRFRQSWQGRDEPSVEGSTIRLASQDPPFYFVKKRRAPPLDYVEKRRVLLPFREQKLPSLWLRQRETSPSSKDRRFVSLRKNLLLTGWTRDKPLHPTLSDRNKSSFRLFTFGFFTEDEKRKTFSLSFWASLKVMERDELLPPTSYLIFWLR